MMVDVTHVLVLAMIVPAIVPAVIDSTVGAVALYRTKSDIKT